jgi:trimethylamine--corrinoid protein Co-methyltransferase
MAQHDAFLPVLSEGALDRIEESAHRLLAEVGISLQHGAATEMLHGRGCHVEKNRVLIPQETVQWALAQVTPHRVHYNRDGSEAFTLGNGQVRFHSGGGLPFFYDLDTGERRLPRLSDVADSTRLLDALPNVDLIIPLLGPQDVPPEQIAVAATCEMLRHTSKPVWGTPIDKPEDVAYIVEMAAACCGGMAPFLERPTMCLCVSPVSPLTFTDKVASAILAVAQSGAPFLALPAPTLGATGPVTMAGTLVQQHAETLASLVLAAAANPGVRTLYCSRISSIDLRRAVSSWGGPEVGMTGAGAGALAHRLGLPCDAYGFATASTLLDPQFAYERLANALVPALAGVDFLSGMGNTENVMIAGLEIAVIDDELASLTKHIVSGCVVNEETLAFDVMAEVIRRDGVYLGEMHTVKQMRQGALWIPGISQRGEVKPGDQAEDVVARARARAKALLASHEVEPLPEDASRHLDEIMIRARRELVED